MSHFTWDQLEPFLVNWSTRAGVAFMRIILLLIVGWLAWRTLRRALQKLELILAHTDDRSINAQASAEQRAKTLTGLLRTITSVGLWMLIAVIGLDQLGLQIGPILAGAGIAGLAIGFGAQYIVRDVITGFFIVLENQLRLGDVAIINGTTGKVESITFRAIVLRDASGVVHVFPNGSINTLANMTMDWSATMISVGIGYNENIDEVMKVMRQTHEEMMEDPRFDASLIEPIEVFGADEFGDSAIIMKARIKTRPGDQWEVGREYRRRLKLEFDRLGIEIPYPQRTIHIKNEGVARAA